MFFFNDDKELEIWISKIQNICEEIGDENLTKCVFLTLGKILANAPVDPKDNVWPIQYVRNTIENLNKNYFGFVKQGILINSINTVAPQELSKFWKQELEINTDFLLAFPNTATILKELSDHLIYLSQLPS